MQTTTKASLAALLCGLGLIGWSPSSHACTSEPYIASMCVMAMPSRASFNNGTYMLAAGQTLAISQYQALFSLIGVTYGGNGQTTFNLPDLRGKVIVGQDERDAAFSATGALGGAKAIQLSVAQLPPHALQIDVPVSVSGITASTMLSGLSATANLGGVRITGPASGLVINAATSGGSTSPNGMYLGKPAAVTAGLYSNAAPTATLNPGSIGGNLAVTVDQGVTAPVTVYGTAATTLGGSGRATGNTGVVGSGAAVPVMPPYLVMPYYIAVQGLYPTYD